jgi:hypothetical protein
VDDPFIPDLYRPLRVTLLGDWRNLLMQVLERIVDRGCRLVTFGQRRLWAQPSPKAAEVSESPFLISRLVGSLGAS